MNKGAFILAMAGAWLLTGCGGLPDLDRGRAAVQSGDLDKAESDLKPLADRGYVEAQKQLARVHAKGQTPEELQEAAHWYGTVIDQDPTVAVQLAKVLLQLGDMNSIARAEELLRAADGRGDTRALPSLVEVYTTFPELDTQHAAPALVERASRQDTPEAESAVIRWYRQNAAEPRYAKQLVDRCQKARDRVPECYIDLARYYRATGQKKPLKDLTVAGMAKAKSGEMPEPIAERLAWSLVSDDVGGEAYPESAYQMLKQVGKSSTQAQVRLARLLVEYPYIDPEGKPEELLLEAVKTGDPEAALGLGRLYMNGITVPVDPGKAVAYLKQAARTLPAAHYYLGRIYKKGQLGVTDPVQAAQHFLTAARAGYINADAALAQLFTDNRGVRPNPVNAFVFASIAAANSVADGKEILNQLQPTMSRKQVQDGQMLLQQELAARRMTLLGAATPVASAAPTTERAP